MEREGVYTGPYTRYRFGKMGNAPRPGSLDIRDLWRPLFSGDWIDKEVWKRIEMKESAWAVT